MGNTETAYDIGKESTVGIVTRIVERYAWETFIKILNNALHLGITEMFAGGLFDIVNDCPSPFCSGYILFCNSEYPFQRTCFGANGRVIMRPTESKRFDYERSGFAMSVQWTGIYTGQFSSLKAS
jgi:hypothetical protein